jgi:hypothetical protein
MELSVTQTVPNIAIVNVAITITKTSGNTDIHLRRHMRTCDEPFTTASVREKIKKILKNFYSNIEYTGQASIRIACTSESEKWRRKVILVAEF